MSLTAIPPADSLQDQQFFRVLGPDGINIGYQYDQQQRALYFRESQVIYPSFHGATHVAEDPVPLATPDLMGLMSAEDKAKLDSILGMRIGVAGFAGAGFPDDGGWMQGDLIFAAGTEFISLERFGNVIRWTVDSPIPLQCGCEGCASLFWVQDETDVAAIRPPVCSGKMPGVNSYGELKVYMFPESTLFDPNTPSAKLNQKGSYPSLIFKRYDDGVVPGAAEYELTLRRDQNNLVQTEVGWAMTPGPTGVTECVWWTGKDEDGNQTRFDLETSRVPGIMGGLLFNGNLITNKTAVITDYTANILSTNQYTCRWWDTVNHRAVGTPFAATNAWQYSNPEHGTSGTSPQQLLLDVGIDLLPVGTMVGMSYFQVGQISGVPINRHFFNQRPQINPNNLWTQVGSVAFGDLADVRQESTPSGGSEDKDSITSVDTTRTFEHTVWGLSGAEEPLLLFDSADLSDTGDSTINRDHRAVIDTELPGLRVLQNTELTVPFRDRPVFLWNRSEVSNCLIRADVGRPEADSDNDFTVLDVMVASQMDSYREVYLQAGESSDVSGQNYLKVIGAHFHDLPAYGTLRTLYPPARFNQIYKYSRKLMFPQGGDANTVNTIALLADYSTNAAFTGQAGDIVELLREDFGGPCVRFEFAPTGPDDSEVSLQVKVGILDMSVPYDNAPETGGRENYVRGLAGGFTVSSIYSQLGTFSGTGPHPSASPAGFVIYDGGQQAGGVEYWNRIEIMQRDNQLWVWWNGMLIPPNPTLSSVLPLPVQVSSPYFPVEMPRRFGKAGIRLWPGASLRSMELRTQSSAFSEFAHGQLSIDV